MSDFKISKKLLKLYKNDLKDARKSKSKRLVFSADFDRSKVFFNELLKNTNKKITIISKSINYNLYEDKKINNNLEKLLKDEKICVRLFLFEKLKLGKTALLFSRYNKVKYNNFITILDFDSKSQFEKSLSDYNGFVTVDNKYFRLDKKEPCHSIGSFSKIKFVKGLDKLITSFL